jgi:hypothetical protein
MEGKMLPFFIGVLAMVIVDSYPAMCQETSSSAQMTMSSSAGFLGSKSWDTLTNSNKILGNQDKQMIWNGLGIKPEVSSFITPMASFAPPVSLHSTAIASIAAGTHKQVDGTPAGAWQGLDKPLAGRLPAPDIHIAQGAIGNTENKVVAEFKTKYGVLMASVAGLYEFTTDQVLPKGTAFLINDDVVVTAKHVIRGLRQDTESGTDLKTPQPISRANVYLLFNVDLEKYSKIKSGLSRYSPDADPEAILLTGKATAYWHDGADVALIRIPTKTKRTKIQLASDFFPKETELVIAGVPATRDMHSYQDELYRKNYLVLGLPDANAERGPYPIIWLTSGPFIGYEDPFARRLMEGVHPKSVC